MEGDRFSHVRIHRQVVGNSMNCATKCDLVCGCQTRQPFKPYRVCHCAKQNLRLFFHELPRWQRSRSDGLCDSLGHGLRTLRVVCVPKAGRKRAWYGQAAQEKKYWLQSLARQRLHFEIEKVLTGARLLTSYSFAPAIMKPLRASVPTSSWSSCRLSARRRYMKHKRDDGAEKQDEETVDVTPIMICVFVVMCCSMLVLLYFFYDYLGTEDATHSLNAHAASHWSDPVFILLSFPLIVSVQPSGSSPSSVWPPQSASTAACGLSSSVFPFASAGETHGLHLSPPAVSTCRSSCCCCCWRRWCSWTLRCSLLIRTPLSSAGSPRTTCRTCTNGRRCACCCCRPSAWPSASPGWCSATRISKCDINSPSVAGAEGFQTWQAEIKAVSQLSLYRFRPCLFLLKMPSCVIVAFLW